MQYWIDNKAVAIKENKRRLKLKSLYNKAYLRIRLHGKNDSVFLLNSSDLPHAAKDKPTLKDFKVQASRKPIEVEQRTQLLLDELNNHRENVQIEAKRINQYLDKISSLNSTYQKN